MTPEERIAKLEVKVDQLTETLEKTNAIVTELRDMLIAARGARWMLALLIAIGSFGAGLAAKYLPFFPLPSR